MGPIPANLHWLESRPGGREWLEALPRLAAECAGHWRLRLEAPFPYAFTSLALPAHREDETDAVLKLLFLDRETEHEGLALRHWAGNGAIRLLDELPTRNALLLERCVPGTPLSGAGSKTALEVLTGLLPRIWKPGASPLFRTLAQESEWWTSGLRSRWMEAGQPFEERLLDAALDALRYLPASQGEQVLLHQDLHGGNVLAAQREPWLVIDPKPLVGEREFGLAPIIRSAELGHSREEARGRLDSLSARLGLDRERARLWCIAQTVAWSIGADSAATSSHLETARWLVDA